MQAQCCCILMFSGTPSSHAQTNMNRN
uniref:Uncharacterized protein n=1 Tax=Arundo donax TaxID=35708 RepID=A0A0A9FSW1_ARUDO